MSEAYETAAVFHDEDMKKAAEALAGAIARQLRVHPACSEVITAEFQQDGGLTVLYAYMGEPGCEAEAQERITWLRENQFNGSGGSNVV